MQEGRRCGVGVSAFLASVHYSADDSAAVTLARRGKVTILITLVWLWYEAAIFDNPSGQEGTWLFLTIGGD